MLKLFQMPFSIIVCYPNEISKNEELPYLIHDVIKEQNTTIIHEFFHYILLRLFSYYVVVYILIFLNRDEIFEEKKYYSCICDGYTFSFHNSRSFKIQILLIDLISRFLNFLIDFIQHIFTLNIPSINRSLILSRNFFFKKRFERKNYDSEILVKNSLREYKEYFKSKDDVIEKYMMELLKNDSDLLKKLIEEDTVFLVYNSKII
jgi:hypothetical protein